MTFSGFSILSILSPLFINLLDHPSYMQVLFKPDDTGILSVITEGIEIPKDGNIQNLPIVLDFSEEIYKNNYERYKM